jgi:hypothetical protein
MIFSACQLADILHVFFYNFRNSFIILVGSLSCLEEYVRVLVSSSDNRVFGIQCIISEFLYSFHIEQVFELIILDDFYLLYLVGSSETVKKVKERNPGLDCRKMCNPA